MKDSTNGENSKKNALQKIYAALRNGLQCT